jgi:hypothetical protein
MLILKSGVATEIFHTDKVHIRGTLEDLGVGNGGIRNFYFLVFFFIFE